MELKNMITNPNSGFKRYFSSDYTIPVAFGLLTLSSFKFFKSMKNMYLINHMKRKLKKAIPVKQITKSSSDYELAYASGKIKYDQSASAIDYHFGVKPVDENSLGVLRKVEICSYKTTENTKFIDHEKRSIYASVNDYDNIYVQNQVFTKGQLTLQDHIIDDSLIIEYAKDNAKPIQIEEEEIKNYVEKNFHLKEEEEEEKEKDEIDLQIKDGTHNEASHPFRQLNKRTIVFKDNSIYFQKSPDQFSKGDVKISFYEIDPVKSLTILAGKKEDKLKAISFTFSGFENFTRRILLGKTAKEVFPKKIRYISEGIIPLKDLLESIQFQVQKNDRFYKLFYFVLIYLIYNYLEQEIALLPENHNHRLLQFYQTLKEVFDFEFIRRSLSFQEPLKNFADDAKLSAGLHYLTTAFYIRIGLLFFSIIIYYCFYDDYKKVTQKRMEKLQKQENYNNIKNQ